MIGVKGKKIDATFSCYNYYYPSFIIYEEEPVVLEIIKITEAVYGEYSHLLKMLYCIEGIFVIQFS